MYFPDGFVDQLRSSVDVVEVIAEYLRLEKRGRNYVALCPFHTEKTPSFNVSRERQIFHCFGCSAGGDVFKFLMLIENIGFPEAVRLLAEKRGIPLPRPAREWSETSAEERDKLLELMEAACAFFHRQLLEQKDSAQSYNYLAERGVARATIEKFRLGYAPHSGDRLLNYLMAQGYPLESIVKSGLARKSELGPDYYDYFRHRIIFPIADHSGRIVAFGGRALGDGQPKYLNSPETPVYSKGKNLFGLNWAKEAIRAANFAVLVEGYFDFLIPYQAGITNVVASLGTGLTADQARLLGRYARNVVVSYDPDAAGMAAARRSLDHFLAEGFRINIARLPSGLDPDSFVRRHGVEAYKEIIRASVPYLDFIVLEAQRAEKAPMNTRAKIAALNNIMPIVAKVPNRVERLDYALRVARLLDLTDSTILAELRRAVEQQRTKLEPDRVVAREILKAELELIKALLENEECRALLREELRAFNFDGLKTKDIFLAIIRLLEEGRELSYPNFKALLDEANLGLLIEIMFSAELPVGDVAAARSCLKALRRFRIEKLEGYVEKIKLKIKEAEARGDRAEINRLLEERIEIQKELIAL